MPKYIPEPTPTSDDIAALQRYIDVELRRIAEALNVKTDGAYGGLLQTDPFTPLPLTPAPVLFNPWDIALPERPDGVILLPLLGSITPITPGVFLLSFTTTVIDILPNDEFAFLLTINGVPSPLGANVDPSNQTEIVTVSFEVLFQAQKGDIFTIFVNSDTSSSLTVTGSEFIMHRVSEEF